MEVQSLLVAEVVGGAKTTAKESLVRSLGHLWEDVSTVQYSRRHGARWTGLISCCFKQNPGLVDQYISSLLRLDPSPTTLVMLGMCLDFCAAQKQKATIEKHKVRFFF